MLVRDIEVACRNVLLEHLDAGEDSVGTRIELDHLAATLLGMTVELTVTVATTNGRAVSFEVSGRDGVDLICRGRHNRFIVEPQDDRGAPRRQGRQRLGLTPDPGRGHARACRRTATSASPGRTCSP